MDEKRCEWCGTLSPVDAVKCTLCRIPFGAPVPPPQDWSHLTGNIPVITAPLLETPAAPNVAVPSPAPAADAAATPMPATVPVAAPAAMPGVAATATSQVSDSQAPASAGSAAQPAAAAFQQQSPPALPTQRVAAEAVVGAAAVDRPDDMALPGWRAPDDPTLRVFADKLEERERRRRGAARSSARRSRGRRRAARLLVWLLGIGLITAFLLLAPARLPGF
ncbi:hypothetical protein [Nocardioides jiangxiensis]|uniref:Zinc ribbon domain-containing protein n=1 Tax=Nocardioides jiangxiensis TaxID=3064524 RepID=A0ABT9AY33_9ACTN|nr:hypothetical protein [Nocardioides sp. WY-20]MDO7866803.1 hypothetical protein [Nocardioides sp. WY-20]